MWRVPLDAPTAHEQLQILFPNPHDGHGLTPLGIPGFAGFFLSLLEQEGFVISITWAFAGDHGDVLIVAARGNGHIEASGAPAAAAVEVFRQVREAIALARNAA